MFARVARPLYFITTQFTSTRVLSTGSIDAYGDKSIKGTRCVSTSPIPSETKSPRSPEPPISASGSFLDVRIPPPEVDPEPSIQVPYVPDLWDSVKPIPDAPMTEVPKVVVVGGTETSHGSARPHTLEDINMPLESDSTQVSQSTERSDSFFDDIAEDLHLPSIQEIKNSLRKILS